MLNSLLNLKRNPHQRYGDETETKPARPKSVPPHLLKPTQESVAVIATHDDLLILRDYSVVSAIGFGSMSDAMLDKNETAAKLDAYRRLLKYVRFDFQLLIGTRPQNLNTYLSKMERKLNRFASMQTCIEKIAAELPAYFAKGTASFDQTFGFAPADLFGTPGEAHAAALTLNQPEFMKAAQFKSEEGRQKMITTIVTQCDETVVRLRHLRETLVQRADHVEMTVQASRALVRTFALVTSYNPRLSSKFRKGPLTTKEIQHAHEELTRRNRQLMDGLQSMNLPCWRISAAELLDDIRYFYHPLNGHPQRELSFDRSASMRLARVR